MLLFFLLSPTAALEASRRGLALWFDQLLPTLLPFTVLSYVILQSNLFASTRFSRQSQHFLTAEEGFVILCGFLFGFPIGSKLTADLYSQKKITKERASVLFVFTNNLSPVFVTTIFQSQLGYRPGINTYLLLYGIPFLYGITMLLVHRRQLPVPEQKNTTSRFHMDIKIIDAGIIHGFETLIKICGYIILFSLTAELLKMIPIEAPTIKTLIIGCTEVTNGMPELSAISNPTLQYALAILFLSWGGMCGLFQTSSIVSCTDLSMKKYLLTRLFLVSLTMLLVMLFQLLL